MRSVRRRRQAQWTAAAVLLVAVGVAFAGGDGRSVVPAAAILGVGGVAVGGVPWLRAFFRRWPGRGRRSSFPLSGPVPWVGAVTVTTLPGEVGPPVGLLHRHGRLCVVLDVRSATPGQPPPGDDRMLTPLLSAAGIVVESIQWVHLPAHDHGLHTVRGPTISTGSAPRTLLVLRIDPFRNEGSIRARGGGDLGVRRLVAVTVTRAAALLGPHGLRPRLLDTDAALRAMTELAAEVLPAPPAAADRWSTQGVREGRRSLTTIHGVHRLLRWSGSSPADLPRRLAAAARSGDSTARRGRPLPPGRMVISQWVGTGRDGILTAGAVRLSAGNPADLDRLEHHIRRGLGTYSGGLRVAVDDQWPALLDTLPWGGPDCRPA